MFIMLSTLYYSQQQFIICFIKFKNLLIVHITHGPFKAYKSHFISHDYIFEQQ